MNHQALCGHFPAARFKARLGGISCASVSPSVLQDHITHPPNTLFCRVCRKLQVVTLLQTAEPWAPVQGGSGRPRESRCAGTSQGRGRGAGRALAPPPAGVAGTGKGRDGAAAPPADTSQHRALARPRGGAWGALREWPLQDLHTDAAAARGGHNDFSLAQGLREPSLYACMYLHNHC